MTQSVDTAVIPDATVVWREGSVVPPPDSSPRRYDLTVTHGEPCTFGQCGEGLICIANVCRKKCAGFCGEVTPECDEPDACIWASDFTGACFRGTLDPGEDCGDGAFCKGGSLCVNFGARSICSPLCGASGSCPAGFGPCQTTQPLQCRICSP